MSEPIVEKRRDQRLQVNREFKSIEEFITEYVTNLSSVGAFIRTDDPLPVGTLVDLRFTVIVDDFESIDGIGEVVRVVPPGGGDQRRHLWTRGRHRGRGAGAGCAAWLSRQG